MSLSIYKPQVKSTCGVHDKVKVRTTEIGYEVAECIKLAQDRMQLWLHINMIKKVLSMYDRASFNQVNNRTNRCNNN
jgi:hypothetical protein